MIGGKEIRCGARKAEKCKSAKKVCKWSNKTKKCSKRNSVKKSTKTKTSAKKSPKNKTSAGKKSTKTKTSAKKSPKNKTSEGKKTTKTSASKKTTKKSNLDCRRKENKNTKECKDKKAAKSEKPKKDTKPKAAKSDKPKKDTKPKAAKSDKPKKDTKSKKKTKSNKPKCKTIPKQKKNQLNDEINYLLGLILPYDRFNNNINEPEAKIYLHEEGKAIPAEILKPSDVCGKYRAYKKRGSNGWDRVFGLELEPGKVNQFISYNMYELEPTTVDDSYRKENISSEQLENHLCGSLIEMYKPSDLNPDHDNFIFTNNKYQVYFTGINHASNREDVVLILTKNNVLHQMMIPENGYIKDIDFGDVRDNEWMFMKHLRSHSYSDMIESKIDTGSTANDGVQLQKSLVAYRPLNDTFVVVVHNGKIWEVDIPENEKLVEVNYDSDNVLFVKTDKNTYKSE